jgi:uncharacterized protein
MSNPLPDVDNDEFRPFWQASREMRLVLPRCRSCGTWRWPPRPICRRCLSFEVEWQEVEPRGSLYSWTYGPAPGVPRRLSETVVVGLVTVLAGEVRLIGNLVDCGVADLRIDAPVEAVFTKIDDKVTLVNWTVA